MASAQPGRPRGFVPIGVFFVLGATMAAYAAVTLLKPGTFLDALWVLNKPAHEQLAWLGGIAALPFGVLSVALGCAAVGWFRRRHWGWVLGTSIHRHQHGGRSCESCDRRAPERRGGSGDCGIAADLYDAAGGEGILPARVLAQLA